MHIRPYFLASRPRSGVLPPDQPALTQASERYRLLLEHSVDVIVEATCQGEILYVSTNVRHVLGYTPAELLNTSLFAHIHPDDLTRARVLFAMPDGQGTCRYRHRNATWRWIEVVSREFVDPDEQMRSVLIVRDISERVEAEIVRRGLEEELQRNTRLSALGLLAGGIAHDFNNLLTVVAVHLNLARQAADAAVARESRIQVDQALAQAGQLAHEILQFSREQDTPHQPVRLPDLVRDVLELLRPTWTPEVEIVPHLPAEGGWILASATQLHQVITNLLVNAGQAMKAAAGRLEVRTETVVIPASEREPRSGLAAGRYVQLVISDTGHGMDPATQRRVFEPFFTTKGHGSGLGLAVVQRVVNDHGASIRLSSEPGRGTTFRIAFVAAPEPPAATAAP